MSLKSILIYHIIYVAVKVLNYAAINIVNPLYFIIDNINGYGGENNGNKYLTLVPTDLFGEKTKWKDIFD